MKLSRVERIILVHQMKILQAIGPVGEREYYAKAEEALRRGYTSEYDELFQSVYPDELSETDCREVWDTLSMYDWLRVSYDKLDDKSGIDEQDLRFSGYSGNDETAFMGYLEYIVEQRGQFDYLFGERKEFNSHFPSREVYQRMLRKYEELTKGGRAEALTKREIQEILYEKVHPENRAKNPPPWEEKRQK